MVRKQSIGIVLGLAFLLTLTAFGRECHHVFSLRATPEGAAIQASGLVDAMSVPGGYYVPGRERLRVEIQAEVADDTGMEVYVNALWLGTITFTQGSGALEFDTALGTPLPPEFGPACQVRNIDVVDDSGTLILQKTSAE